MAGLEGTGVAKLTLAVAVMAFAPSRAHADITATYGSDALGTVMTVEIDDQGNVRAKTPDKSTQTLIKDDICYLVTYSEDGPYVAKCEDYFALNRERFERLLEEKGMKKPSEKDGDNMPGFDLVATGKETINGRTGTAYSMKDAPDSMGPVVVISNDPDLAPLGKAMAMSFQASAKQMGGMLGSGKNPFQNMTDILQSGTPLLFSGAELQSVKRNPVDAAEFSLPAEPETRAELRKRLGIPERP